MSAVLDIRPRAGRAWHGGGYSIRTFGEIDDRGRDKPVETVDALDYSVGALISVKRFDAAREATVVIEQGLRSNMRLSLPLTAAALRELARRLLDAADDVEQVPA